MSSARGRRATHRRTTAWQLDIAAARPPAGRPTGPRPVARRRWLPATRTGPRRAGRPPPTSGPPRPVAGAGPVRGHLAGGSPARAASTLATPACRAARCEASRVARTVSSSRACRSRYRSCSAGSTRWASSSSRSPAATSTPVPTQAASSGSVSGRAATARAAATSVAAAPTDRTRAEQHLRHPGRHPGRHLQRRRDVTGGGDQLLGEERVALAAADARRRRTPRSARRRRGTRPASATSSCGSGARVTGSTPGRRGRVGEPVNGQGRRRRARRGGWWRPARSPAATPDEERQQVQRARVGPVQVLDHERGPPFGAQGPEQVPDRGEQPGPVGGDRPEAAPVSGDSAGMRAAICGRDVRGAPAQGPVQQRAGRPGRSGRRRRP